VCALLIYKMSKLLSEGSLIYLRVYPRVRGMGMQEQRIKGVYKNSYMPGRGKRLSVPCSLTLKVHSPMLY